MSLKFRWAGAVVLSIALVVVGCSQQGPLTVVQLDDIKLREVGELYRQYQIMAKKAPRSLKDFNAIGDADSPTAYGAIRSGDVVVRWDVTLPDTDPEPTSPPSDEVLAYLKSVPESGGNVLMVDRRVRRMTPEEFKAAKLAGTAKYGPPIPDRPESSAARVAGVTVLRNPGSPATSRFPDRGYGVP